MGAVYGPFHIIRQGEIAENFFAKLGVSSDTRDALAVERYNRVQKDIEADHFKTLIFPELLKSKKGDVAYGTEKYLCLNVTLTKTVKLKRVFVKRNCNVTVGNAPGNSGASTLVMLMDKGVAKVHGLQSATRLVAYDHVGVGPKYMGIRLVLATKLALQKSSLSFNSPDVIEANQAFAVQACAVKSDLGPDPAKVNPNGSGISLSPDSNPRCAHHREALYGMECISGRDAFVTYRLAATRASRRSSSVSDDASFELS